MTVHMSIELDEAEEAQLRAIAEHEELSLEALIQKLVAERLAYDRWFRAEVRKGIEAADRGELIDHEEVVAHMAELREMLLVRSRS